MSRLLRRICSRAVDVRTQPLIRRTADLRARLGGLQSGDNVSNVHRLFGDVNGDKSVNGLDLTAFRNAFGSVATDTNYVSFLDFNGDGAINGTDLSQFRNRFGVVLP